MNKREYHEKILSLIYKYGVRFSKKHGNYIKLPFYRDSFFVLDTWNGSITLKVGSGQQVRSEGVYDWYYPEPEGEKLFWLGSQAGGFSKGDVSEEQMVYWYTAICALILKGFYK
jgi:hypothetical protein